MAGSKGSFDLARDVRGFAVKLYTQEGNWDIVGNNIPVFFIQDPIKFPDVIHAVKPEPDRGFPQAQSAHDNFWDFVSLMPESTHMLMWVMSDRAIPRSFRFMEGFGVHTFRFVNARGRSTFVKLHWKPKQGLQSVLWDEAVKINGADPDFHRRDLWDAITTGDLPEWELGIQRFDDAFADRFEFDVLDPTKLIPEEVVPAEPIGRLVLDRVVDNFFAETEQVAFCTQNIVPGVDFTNDPLLQGRNFSYLDTQLKRLGGPNFTHIPVNAPKCPMAHFQQDGHMAMTNPVGRVNYEPNSSDRRRARPAGGPGRRVHHVPRRRGGRRSAASGPSPSPTTTARPTCSGAASSPRSSSTSSTPSPSSCSKVRVAGHPGAHGRPTSATSTRTSPPGSPTGSGCRASRRGPRRPWRRTTTSAPSPKLSILANGPDSFAGRKLGVLVSDGAPAPRWSRRLQAAAKAEGQLVEVIAPAIGGVALDDGTALPADQMVGGGPSVLYDAVAILVIARPGATALAAKPAAKDFVSDAHAHLQARRPTPPRLCRCSRPRGSPTPSTAATTS